MKPTKLVALSAAGLMLLLAMGMCVVGRKPSANGKWRRLSRAEMATVFGRQKVTCDGCSISVNGAEACDGKNDCGCIDSGGGGAAPVCATGIWAEYGGFNTINKAMADDDSKDYLYINHTPLPCFIHYQCKQGDLVPMRGCQTLTTKTCGTKTDPDIPWNCRPCTKGERMFVVPIVVDDCRLCPN